MRGKGRGGRYHAALVSGGQREGLRHQGLVRESQSSQPGGGGENRCTIIWGTVAKLHPFFAGKWLQSFGVEMLYILRRKMNGATIGNAFTA